jgi:hypothetical protein
MSAYSNSESSALDSETRCSDETILVGWRDMADNPVVGDRKGKAAWRECNCSVFSVRLAKTLIDNL